MPDEEHNLTIRIETNAAQAAEEMERLDAAQQNASNSGSKLEETERRGSSAEARRIRLRAKYMRSYIRDIKAIRQNSEQTAKSLSKLRAAEKVTATGEERTIKNSGIMLKRLIAVAATVALIKRGFQSLGNSLDFGKNYLLAGMMTGTDAVKAQMWERLLKPFGGNLGSAAGSLGNLQRNIALANMGEQPFSDLAYRLLGDAIQTRPGMTQEEFLRNIAPRMKQLSRGEALLAGQSVGISPDMALMLNQFGADFEKELKKQREAARVAQEEAINAQKNRQKVEDILNGIKSQTLRIANKLFGFLPDDPKILQEIGAISTHVGNIAGAIVALKALKWLIGGETVSAGIKSVLWGGAKATAKGAAEAAPYLGHPAAVIVGQILSGIGLMGAGTMWSAKWGESRLRKAGIISPVGEEQKSFSDETVSEVYNSLGRTGAFNTNTPLNYMPPSTAFAMGMRAGAGAAGDKVLNLGGITINTTSDDPQEIAERVAGAGRIVLDEFARLDRLQAGEYYA